MSALMMSPRATVMISPGTIWRASTLVHWVSRRTRVFTDSRFFRSSSALWELRSFQKPMTALVLSSAKMMTPSSVWPKKNERAIVSSSSHGIGPQ